MLDILLYVSDLNLDTWIMYTELLLSLQYIHRFCAGSIAIHCGIKPSDALENKGGLNLFDGSRNTVRLLSLLMPDPH